MAMDGMSCLDVGYVLGYPLKFLLLNLRPQGRDRTVFGYHFVQNFDAGFYHLVSRPPPGHDILHPKCECGTLQSRPFCRSLEGSSITTTNWMDSKRRWRMLNYRPYNLDGTIF